MSILQQTDSDYDSEDDQEYVPSGKEDTSEEEGSGGESDPDLPGGEDAEAADSASSKAKKKKRTFRKSGKNCRSKKAEETDGGRHGSSRMSAGREAATTEAQPCPQKIDDIWARFKANANPKPPQAEVKISATKEVTPNCDDVLHQDPEAKPCAAAAENGKVEESMSSSKVTITEVYRFAGEEVKISKTVDATSIAPSATSRTDAVCSQEQVPKPAGVKRPAAGGGLSRILDTLVKKPKLSTLEKSKLDWESFKQEKGLSEELTQFNRGKEGYLERQDFLQRADVKQWEKERSLRQSKRF